MARVTVRISDEALKRLDGFADGRGLNRSDALRALLEGEIPQSAPADREEALTLLSESARGGSVFARIALARLTVGAAEPGYVERRRDELAAARARRGAA
jgi:predicted transcriptional regulator